MDEQIYDDLDAAEEIMKAGEHSLVLIQNGDVVNTWTGHPIPLLLHQMENTNHLLNASTIGLDFLGKAGALLCAYTHVKAVYTQKQPQSNSLLP